MGILDRLFGKKKNGEKTDASGKHEKPVVSPLTRSSNSEKTEHKLEFCMGDAIKIINPKDFDLNDINELSEVLGLSTEKLTKLEQKILDIRSRSVNARDMIEKLVPSKRERYKCSTGFLVGWAITSIQCGTDERMKAKMGKCTDDLRELFDVDKDTFYANRIIFSECMKNATDFSNIIMRMREFEDKMDQDRESFACGVILGNVIAREMIKGYTNF